MEEIKQEQTKALKDIIGRGWKKISQSNGIIGTKTSGVKIKDGDIVVLVLVNFWLKTLSESIGNLKSLRTLDLRSNRLKTLPESIGNLKSLEMLFLRDNQLTTLPESIGNLKSLGSLYLRTNQLKTIPESIGTLKSLRTLDLRRNQLKTIPESIGNLKSLVTLDLDSNQLKTIPESIGNLKSLGSLDLDSNQLTTLPESIGNLKSLRTLNLRRNQLTTLPESIGNLKSLRTLTLDDNPFNQKFKKIIKMTNGNVHSYLRKIVEKKAIKEKYKEERFVIEKLIQEKKISRAISKLKKVKNSAKEYNLPEILSWTKKNLKICNEPIIKKSVLDLGTKFARLQIAEISEVCRVDDIQLIVNIVKNMIKNKEIYAQYFSSTKSVAFDQQANIDEIDKLMSTYKDWEDKKVGKK